MSNRVAATAATALAPIIWGTTFVVTTELLPPGHPLLATVLRALPAGLLALAITRALPRGVWWWKALVLGGLNIGVFFPLLFVAAAELPGGVAATAGALQPLIIVGLTGAVLGRRPTGWNVVWAVVGAFGVSAVVLGPDAALSPVGLAAGLGMAASMALGTVLTKRWGRPPGVSALGMAGWQLTAGGLLVAPLLAFEGLPAASAVDGGAIAGWLWLGAFGGLVSYWLWFRGIGMLPVTSISLMALLSPLTAATLGALVLAELLTPLQLVGFVVAFGAMVAGQFAGARRAPAAPVEAPEPTRTQTPQPTRRQDPEPAEGSDPTPAPEAVEGSEPTPTPEPVGGSDPAPAPEPVDGSEPALRQAQPS